MLGSCNPSCRVHRQAATASRDGLRLGVSTWSGSRNLGQFADLGAALFVAEACRFMASVFSQVGCDGAQVALGESGGVLGIGGGILGAEWFSPHSSDCCTNYTGVVRGLPPTAAINETSMKKLRDCLAVDFAGAEHGK